MTAVQLVTRVIICAIQALIKYPCPFLSETSKRLENFKLAFQLPRWALFSLKSEIWNQSPNHFRQTELQDYLKKFDFLSANRTVGNVCKRLGTTHQFVTVYSLTRCLM